MVLGSLKLTSTVAFYKLFIINFIIWSGCESLTLKSFIPLGLFLFLHSCWGFFHLLLVFFLRDTTLCKNKCKTFMYFSIFSEQTKTKAEIKQHLRLWVATLSFDNDLWVPDSLHLNHFPRGTLKSFPVKLDFGGWLKVKMSKAHGLHPRMLPDDCEKWPYAALIIPEGGCCKACPDGCLGQRGKSRMMRTWEWRADTKKKKINKHFAEAIELEATSESQQ